MILAYKKSLVISCLIFAFLISICFRALGQAAPPAGKSGKVYIVLWFDTEDYILPQSDDAALRIADMLTRLGVRATFKVVGEKGRTLERRGRTDVIAALKRHEIGYHANTHSQHPTVAEYEEPLDWESGVEEFTRRERPGFEDLTRIFGKPPTCYGQPGSSWAPQSFAALKQWGVNVYLDEGEQVGLDGKPFWYGGLLNIFNTREGEQLRSNEDWSNLDDAKIKFRQYYARMTSDPEGGLISIYFHPAEFIHAQFWDATNFLHGANPPREEWKVPPMKSPQEIERHFKYLEDLVTYLKSFPSVRFITASEALNLYRDAAQKRAFSAGELADIARQVGPEFSFQVRNGYNLSASEQMELLNKFVAAKIRGNPAESVVLEGTPYGPSSPLPEMNQNLDVSWSQFSRTVLDVGGFMEKNGQVPTAVWFGSTAVPPQSYLVALASVATTLISKGGPPSSVPVGPAHLAAEKYVADDSPKLWGWVIFPVGFRAPNLMALAKLQAWTLKPARLINSGQ
ncbi:MAG TPA: polysaccharide deacetylase family protein [Terriglobia bacterium]|nr:polysaccharide deacetylase family protein [Terriglobia bacterium]